LIICKTSPSSVQEQWATALLTLLRSLDIKFHWLTSNKGVAGVEEIDTVMKLGMSHPMGPLQLADFIGLDVCLSIMKVLHEGFANAKYTPCPLLVEMVSAGHLGVKSGSGFYKYATGSKELIVADRFRKNQTSLS